MVAHISNCWAVVIDSVEPFSFTEINVCMYVVLACMIMVCCGGIRWPHLMNYHPVIINVFNCSSGINIKQCYNIFCLIWGSHVSVLLYMTSMLLLVHPGVIVPTPLWSIWAQPGVFPTEYMYVSILRYKYSVFCLDFVFCARFWFFKMFCVFLLFIQFYAFFCLSVSVCCLCRLFLRASLPDINKWMNEWIHGLLDYCVAFITACTAENNTTWLQLTETGVIVLHNWCSSTSRRVFQNACFGVTEQIKGVETTIFATVKHYFKNASVYIVSLQCNKTLIQVFHYTRHYETVLQLSRPAFRNTTTKKGHTGGSVSQHCVSC